MANSPVCSCHDEPAVAGIYVAFSPNIADVFCSYLVECVCFEPVWCRSESTCIRLGDVSVPTKAYAQQRLWSCHDCWVCLVVRAGCAKRLFMQVSFFWSSSIRVIYVCVCVCVYCFSSCLLCCVFLFAFVAFQPMSIATKQCLLCCVVKVFCCVCFFWSGSQAIFVACVRRGRFVISYNHNNNSVCVILTITGWWFGTWILFFHIL